MPEVICSDQGTNFTAELTQFMLEKLGSAQRFSTPEHPESNGVVERWNRVLKNMLSHVIKRDSRNWDKLVPFVLSAYREVPHDTTELAPFRMLYGINPTGPLAILQRTWAGDVSVPETLREEPAKYLRQLHDQLEVAAEVAGLTASVQQKNYAERYNRTVRAKTFQVGDQVLLSDTDRASKMAPRWIGPLAVNSHKRRNSYRVERPGKKTAVVHANRLRLYYARVGHVGVIFQEDEDFGEVNYAPRKGPNSPGGTNIAPKRLAHLDENAREAVAKVLSKHKALFDGTSSKASVGEHRIKLEEGFHSKKAYPYCVPELLREKVSRQISELLELGLIYPIESDFAHPVV